MEYKFTQLKRIIDYYDLILEYDESQMFEVDLILNNILTD